MGFYGNITNTSRTQFQFDKVYSNRWEMDSQKAIDGIYAGRYVLIEYDQESQLDYYTRASLYNAFSSRDDDGTSINYYILNYTIGEGATDETIIKKNDMYTRSSDIVFTAIKETNSSGGTFYKNIKFYLFNPNKTWSTNTNAAVFELISDTAKEGIPTYTVNYNIDTEYYGKGRAYDSTVWQKTYMDGVEKYIMIAELNTVVPTFDVSADAPTQMPLIPHFDTQSTDVYYKLHWQPTWGLRVKEAQVSSLGDALGNLSSIDEHQYPTDEKVNYQTYKFNPITGINEKDQNIEYQGAIYFNRAGFNPVTRTYYTQFDNEGNLIEGKYQDIIAVEPTGQSGQQYNKHDGTTNQSVQPDIQELRILLPSLGNTLSDIWDIIYGYDKKVTQQGQEISTPDNSIRYRDIYWKDALSLEEDINLGGMTRDVNTVAGCINSIHDLMGMIITDKNDEYLINELYKPIELTSATFEPNKYYILQEDNKYIIADTFDLNAAYYIYTPNNGENWFAKNYIYISGNQNEPKTYYRINKYNVYNSIDNEDLQFSYKEEIVDNVITYTYTLGSADTVVTTSTDLTDQAITAYRESVVEKLLKYLEDNNYNTMLYRLISIDEVSGRQNVEAIMNRKAIFDLDENGNFDFSKIYYHPNTYAYEYLEIPEMAQNLSTIYGCILQMKKLLEVENSETRDPATVTGAINRLNDLIGNFSDLMPGEFLIADNKGHVNSAGWTTAQDYSYTNYNSKEPNSIKKEDFSTNENRWIELSLDENNSKAQISIKHNFNPIDNTVTVSDKNTTSNTGGINDNNDDTLQLYTPIVDSQGHVVGHNEETVTLPYSFKYFETCGNAVDNTTTDLDEKQDSVSEDGSTVTAGEPVKDTSIVADNTQDTLIINPYNKWIQTKFSTVSDDFDDKINVLEIAHEVHGIKIDDANTTDLNTESNVEPINTVTVQDTAYDNAGHITENHSHTYILPYGFKYINSNGLVSIEDSDLYTVISAGNETIAESSSVNEKITPEIDADNTQDKFAVDTANKWIQIKTTNDTAKTGHKVEIAHEIHAIDEVKMADSDLNDIGTFTVQDISHDRAGHLIAKKPHTYILPYNYKTIRLETDTTTVDGGYGPAQDFDVVAKNQIDILKMGPQNRWITINGYDDAENGRGIIIGHAIPDENSQSKGITHIGEDSNSLSTFGREFKIPIVKYDETGHIFGNDVYTVKMPIGSIENKVDETTASVLTAIDFDPETGKILPKSNNVGKLALTDYTVVNHTLASDNDIKATDSINAAFNKLQTQMYEEEAARDKAIKDLDYTDNDTDAGRYVIAINQTDGQIALTKGTLPNVNLSANTGEYISGIEQINGKVSISTTALPSTEELTAETGKYISGIKQVNGKIEIASTVALPDYSSYWKRIEDLEKLVQEQNTVITQLTTRIATLEAYHNEETLSE